MLDEKNKGKNMGGLWYHTKDKLTPKKSFLNYIYSADTFS